MKEFPIVVQELDGWSVISSVKCFSLELQQLLDRVSVTAVLGIQAGRMPKTLNITYYGLNCMIGPGDSLRRGDGSILNSSG
jgi:hypothetical protein